MLITENPHDELLLSQTLRLAGLAVNTAHDVRSVMAKWSAKSWDFLVVAAHLPDPLSAVREIRRVAIAPLILIIDPVPEELHLALLEAGADWVIERPYSVRMLIGYTKVMMRNAGNVVRESLPTLQHDTLSLDPGSRTVKVAGKQPQRLSQLEFRLLHTLMINRGQVLPTETIVEHVWGYTGEGDRSLVRGLINRLRLKVEVDPHNPKYILTVSGVGYSFGNDAI